MDELSQEAVEAGSENISAPQTAAPSEPRMSEEARRVQAAKDAEIARIRKEAQLAHQELDTLRLHNEQLQATVDQYGIQTIPDEQARQYFASQKQQEDVRRQLTRLQQRAAIAEAKLEHKDTTFDDEELQTILRASRNEADFKTKTDKLAEKKRQEAKEKTDLEQRIRQEVEAQVRKESGVNRVSTSVPGTGPATDETVYRQRYEEAVKSHDVRAIIMAKRELEAARQRR